MEKMSFDWLPTCCNLLQIAALIVICARTYRLLDNRKKYLPIVFFLFGMGALMLSELYWLIHGMIRPDFRFPYSASEFSQDGGLLLLSGVLVSLLGKNHERISAVMLGTVAFSIANIALWIAWSGEWFKDIFDGIIFMYYLCVVARSVSRTGALSRWEWGWLAFFGAVLMIGEGLCFFVPETVKLPLDACNYAVMHGILLFFYVKVLRSFKSGTSPLQGLCLAYCGFSWSLLSMYMSAEPIYFIGLCSSTAMMVIMYAAIKRVVRE